MTTPPTDVQLDMLIRSTSSILSIVKPQVTFLSVFAPRSASSPTVSQLDRIALLFVTKKEADVVAVTIDLRGGNVTVRVAADDAVSTQNQSEKLIVAPNPSIPGDKLEALEQDVRIPGPHWLSEYLQFGPAVVPFRNHVAQLEHLIQKLQPLELEEAQAMKNLRRYIYFRCLPELEERVSKTVPGLPGWTFESVFDELSPSAVEQNWVRPTSRLPSERLEKRDEKWLIDAILEENHRRGLSTTEKQIPQDRTNGVDQLDTSAWSARSIFFIFQVTLQGIRTSVQALEEFKKSRKTLEEVKELVPQANEHLDQLSGCMEMLYMLTHHSRLMWYVMDSSVVKNVFALQSGTRDTHPLASEAEEVDDIIEDSGIFARDSHTGKVQKWLKGLCHWHRAFVDLGNKGAIVKLLAPRKLQIKVVEAMPIAEPTKQAPLSQTLMALRPLNQEFEKAARDSLRYQMQYAKGGGGMGMVLAGDGSCDKEWSQLFKGRAHCEAYLACDVETQISIKEIGVSKRCCYCCAVFLKALEPNVKYTRSDDRVYPWAPPANAPRPAKEAVLKALQDKLYEHIVVRRHGDSGAGSDDEATGGVMVPKPATPKTETWNLNPPSPA